jgi:type I restriction enzyme M protein
MNMILHGVEAPNIIHQYLAENISDIQKRPLRYHSQQTHPLAEKRAEVHNKTSLKTGEANFLVLQLH